VFRSIGSIGLRTRFVLIGIAVVVPLVAVMLQLAHHEREGALELIAMIVLISCVVGLVGGEAFLFWPLRALARTAQALERGDYSARPRLTGASEVGALEHSLDRMAEAIQRREDELNASRAAFEQAVEDAKRATDAKSQFLASMSHEIRTPLSCIVGYNDLLLAQDLQPGQRRYAERIEAAAASVLAVIDGILDVSRIESGEVEIDRRPFSLAGLVDNAVSMVRPRAELKGLDLTFDFGPRLPAAVLGDEARLRQVLLNLLTNAVKFTTRGGVAVHVRRRGKSIRFSVLDTGIGIAKAQHHRLFQRYFQVHDGTDQRDRGSGLGLPISKELTELMGGKLGFSSKPGHGSTFWVELALPPTEEFTDDLRQAPACSPVAGRILVADDHEMNREITSAMLTLAGHEVHVVVDGAQALAAVRGQTYDLVLMDIEMRGINGVEAARLIRSLDAPAGHVPLIAMTANVLPQQIRAFRDAGMDGHLGKAVHPQPADRQGQPVPLAGQGRRGRRHPAAGIARRRLRPGSAGRDEAAHRRTAHGRLDRDPAQPARIHRLDRRPRRQPPQARRIGPFPGVAGRQPRLHQAVQAVQRAGGGLSGAGRPWRPTAARQGGQSQRPVQDRRNPGGRFNGRSSRGS
jgi:signal transduction histidine kinase/CheY-like chemotaxis protein